MEGHLDHPSRQLTCALAARTQPTMAQSGAGGGVASTSNSYLDYEPTLMYGKHTQQLGKEAKEAFKRIEKKKKRLREQMPIIIPYQRTRIGQIKRFFKHLQIRFKYSMCSEWVFLLILGILMALLSFGMDYLIQKVQKAHYWLFLQVEDHMMWSYLEWVCYPTVIVLFSVYFVNIVSPQAVGSGIPEMKTILRGVVLHEYLTCKVLLSKMIGLTASIGSGLPIGKEGPFVHIASIVATLLNKLLSGFTTPYQNESRDNELLAAACAVGVACNFAAPIGGVLFSIEVTATYFAVKNYWRGFFSAVCGAFMFRLLAVWVAEEETITALFKTSFRLEFPYDLQELLSFVAIGAICGFMGAAFIYIHRSIVNFNRSHLRLRTFLQRSRAIYPAIITVIITTMTYPHGLGQYMAGDLTLKQAVNGLFDNRTWNHINMTNMTSYDFVNQGWLHPTSNVFTTLTLFIVCHFFMTAIAITIAVPSGVFMPVFLIGAAFGRLIGEVMTVLYPNGFVSGGTIYHIVPGGYAVVGAASLSGAVTHTISTAVIVFELTGQIAHILPVMLAVLISNAIARIFQPSIYESIIQIKELPYLPDVAASNKSMYAMHVSDFMQRQVKYLSRDSTTYKELKLLLTRHKFKSFPMIDNPHEAILIGSVQRGDLETLLDTFEHKLVDKYAVAAVDPFDNEEEDDEDEEDVRTSQIGRFTRSTSMRAHSANDQLVDVTTTAEEDAQKAADDDFNSVVDFTSCTIDAAPFHLVEKTSLHKVHSLFSLLSLQHCYVTNVGKLVGVVSLKEVRLAIERVNRRRGSTATTSDVSATGGKEEGAMTTVGVHINRTTSPHLISNNTSPDTYTLQISNKCVESSEASDVSDSDSP